MMAAALDTQLHYPHHHHLPPPQPLNRVTTCDRHPDQQVTGFCASCLRERLAGLEPATRRLRSSSASSGASAALKSLFFRPATHSSQSHHNPVTVASSSLGSSILPQLRRCKSFSLGRGAPPAAAFEPQRRSCDVRGRSTLGTLFHLDDSGPSINSACPFSLPLYCPAGVPNAEGGEIVAEPHSLGRVSGVAVPVPESREAEEEEDREKDGRRYREVDAGVRAEEVGEVDDESRGVRPPWAVEVDEEQKEEKEEEMRKQEQLRPMKDHIDLDAQSKKTTPKDLREIAGSFWIAASVFSKRLQNWRRKQKEKKHRHAAVGASKTPAVATGTVRPSSRSRRFSRETQSEVAEYAFGRRSCDTEPRFSLDAGRVSFDDPRFSWDEPRASWDGYLTGGGRSSLPRLPPMLSVLEDAPAVVQRSDGQIPVEEDATTPGGSSQTRDYYLDSSSHRRRRSLDRSSSRRSSVEAATAAELLKPVSDARLSPDATKLSPTAMADEYLQHVSKFERDNNSSSMNVLHDDCWESLEKGGGVGTPRKPRVWSKAWSLWGLIHRRRGRGGGARVVERSFSETWQVLPGEGRQYTRKFFRSNSSVGCRHSFHGGSNGGLPGSTIRRNGLEINGHVKKRREEFVLERSRSSRRYSPGHFDGGLPRFYVTPVPGSAVLAKGRCKSSHSLPRSVLRLY